MHFEYPPPPLTQAQSRKIALAVVTAELTDYETAAKQCAVSTRVIKMWRKNYIDAEMSPSNLLVKKCYERYLNQSLVDWKEELPNLLGEAIMYLMDGFKHLDPANRDDQLYAMNLLRELQPWVLIVNKVLATPVQGGGTAAIAANNLPPKALNSQK